MRIHIQTSDRPAIPLLPFYEIYDTMIETSPENVTASHAHLKTQFPKAKRILFLLTRKDFAYRESTLR